MSIIDIESSFYCAVILLIFEIIALCIGATICFYPKKTLNWGHKRPDLENNQMEYFKISCWKLYFRVIYGTITITIVTVLLILLIKTMKEGI